jgi:LysR family transcriptional regulator, nitrogen assimilation regulatory protein
VSVGDGDRAAAALGFAQPVLNRQIRLLEEDLGVSLFRRTHPGVQLTDEGERLRASTAAPLRQLELAVQYGGTPVAKIERGVRLGLPETTVDVLAAPLITSLSTVFSNLTFSVTAGKTEALVDAMLKGAVDVALINPVPDDRVFDRDLVAEDLMVVGGAQIDETVTAIPLSGQRKQYRLKRSGGGSIGRTKRAHHPRITGLDGAEPAVARCPRAISGEP